jgi:hypothetical protein
VADAWGREHRDKLPNQANLARNARCADVYPTGLKRTQAERAGKCLAPPATRGLPTLTPRLPQAQRSGIRDHSLLG